MAGEGCNKDWNHGFPEDGCRDSRLRRCVSRCQSSRTTPGSVAEWSSQRVSRCEADYATSVAVGEEVTRCKLFDGVPGAAANRDRNLLRETLVCHNVSRFVATCTTFSLRQAEAILLGEPALRLEPRFIAADTGALRSKGGLTPLPRLLSYGCSLVLFSFVVSV